MAARIKLHGVVVEAGDKIVYVTLDGTRRKAYFRGIYEEYIAPHTCPGCRCPRTPHDLNGALRIRVHGDRYDSLVPLSRLHPWEEPAKGADDESR